MTAMWIPIVLGAAALALVAWTRWRHSIERAERGTVSAQWLSEQRANDRHYSER